MAATLTGYGLLLLLTAACLPANGLPMHCVNLFFSGKQIGLITGLLCNERDGFELMKMNAQESRRSNFAIVEELSLSGLMNVTEYTVPRVGVVLDMGCPGAERVLQWASENRLFDERRHWLIFTTSAISQEDLEAASSRYQPDMFDPQEYLDEGTDDMEQATKITEFNAILNADLLRDLAQEREHRLALITNFTEDVEGFLDLRKYVDLRALVDSEVTLAVPVGSQEEEEEGSELFEIHRKTIYTNMVIAEAGRMYNGTLEWALDPKQSANLRRNDFQGAVMKAGSAVMRYVYLSRSGELTPEVYDTWAQGGLQLSQLVEAQANFRMLVKTFDQYGWAENGHYTGLVGWMGVKGADLTASGLLLTPVRMGALDYYDSTWFVELGMIFRQPSLSQVANIFVLPFSTGVWLSGLGVLTLAILVLLWQLKATNQLGRIVSVADIVTFFTAAACQQGINLGANSVSVRVTMLVFDLTSLFLFTSYSANIVALLQSPSNRINTISDLTDSSLDVAVESLPYEMKLFEEETSATVRDLCSKKLDPKHGHAFVNATEGISQVRKELFAFHGELSTAYKEISLTFTETEKCGLKSINIFPHRYNGPALYKNSPYRESLAPRFYWVRETGLMSRTFRRWLNSKPACSGDSGGFSSVGMLDMMPVFLLMVYGYGAALVLLFMEKVAYRFGCNCFSPADRGKEAWTDNWIRSYQN